MARAMVYGTLVKGGPLQAESGWISPTGNWWSVDASSHYAFAKERCPQAPEPVSALEQRGWVHVSYVGVFIGDRCEITPEQYDVLLQFMRHAKGSYSYGGSAYRDSVALLGYDPFA